MSNFCDESLTQLDWILNTGGSTDRQTMSEKSMAPCCSNASRRNDQNFRDSNIKPPYSYAKLIVLAIKSQEDGRATLNQIYQFITTNFKFYRDQPANSSWKNSIRHNLSLSKTFKKISRSKDNPGKGCYWALNDDQAMEKSKKDYCFSKRSTMDQESNNGLGPRINPQYQKLLDQISSVGSSIDDQTNLFQQKSIDVDQTDQDNEDILFSASDVDNLNLYNDEQSVDRLPVSCVSVSAIQAIPIQDDIGENTAPDQRMIDLTASLNHFLISIPSVDDKAERDNLCLEKDPMLFNGNLSLSLSVKDDEFSSWFTLPDPHENDRNNRSECNNEIEDDFDWDSLLAKN